MLWVLNTFFGLDPSCMPNQRVLEFTLHVGYCLFSFWVNQMKPLKHLAFSLAFQDPSKKWLRCFLWSKLSKLLRNKKECSWRFKSFNSWWARNPTIPVAPLKTMVLFQQANRRNELIHLPHTQRPELGDADPRMEGHQCPRPRGSWAFGQILGV